MVLDIFEKNGLFNHPRSPEYIRPRKSKFLSVAMLKPDFEAIELRAEHEMAFRVLTEFGSSFEPASE
jgi:hypothetical protein